MKRIKSIILCVVLAVIFTVGAVGGCVPFDENKPPRTARYKAYMFDFKGIPFAQWECDKVRFKPESDRCECTVFPNEKKVVLSGNYIVIEL